MQGIVTKWRGPTARLGSRITATAGGGRKLTVPWEHALNVPQNHRRAAELLAEELGWAPEDYGRLAMGSNNDSGFMFVFVNRDTLNDGADWRGRLDKRALFYSDECAMQLHVPVADHINNHPHCLHIWRPHGVEIPRPPATMVGIAGAGQAEAAEVSRKLGLGVFSR